MGWQIVLDKTSGLCVSQSLFVLRGVVRALVRPLYRCALAAYATRRLPALRAFPAIFLVQVSGDDEDFATQRAAEGCVVSVEVFIQSFGVYVPLWHVGLRHEQRSF